MTRTTTISEPDTHGMVEIKSRQPRGDLWISLKFHWLKSDMDSEGYHGALKIHHASMDYIANMAERDVPSWAKETPVIVDEPPVSQIMADAVAAEPEPPQPVNVLLDVYRERGVN